MWVIPAILQPVSVALTPGPFFLPPFQAAFLTSFLKSPWVSDQKIPKWTESIFRWILKPQARRIILSFFRVISCTWLGVSGVGRKRTEIRSPWGNSDLFRDLCGRNMRAIFCWTPKSILATDIAWKYTSFFPLHFSCRKPTCVASFQITWILLSKSLSQGMVAPIKSAGSRAYHLSPESFWKGK